MLPTVVNVSDITGQRVVGRVTSWQTRNGPFNVEHLAGRNPNGHLIVYWWSPQHDWQAVNVTQKTGQPTVGDATSWQTPNGPFNVEHLAARNANGDVIVYWWSPQHDWQAVNVSQKTGQKVTGQLTSWQTMNGPFNVEHLAGRNPNGDLIVFWWSPQHDWKSVNVSQKAGQKIAGDLTSWQTKNGPFNVEHLAGRNPNGDLIVFWWSPQHDWQAVNVSQKTGQKLAGGVTSWQTRNGPFNVEHVAGRNPNGDLIVFWWSPQHDWQAIDVTAFTGGNIAGAPSSFQVRDADGNAEMLAARSNNNSLLYHWWKPAFDWEMADLTKLTGRLVFSDPEAWTTPSGNHIVEHLACEGDNHALLVFFFDNEIRTEGISTERWIGIGPRNITCVVMAVAADPNNAALVYAATQFGGVWKSRNGGSSWSPTMDNLLNPCASALAVSRSQLNVVYAGMSPGSVGPAGGNPTSLYRSENWGRSWTPKTTMASTFCRALALHPVNPEIVYFAGDQGLHKSADGGGAWNTSFAGDIDDVQIDADAPDTLYAAVRDQGIFKTTDGGANWERKGAAVTFTVADDDGNMVSASLDGQFRTRLAIGEDQRTGKHGTRFVVAKVQGTIIVSNDGGDNWRVLPGTDHGLDRQNWWDSCVAVCPADEDFIVAGGGSIQFTLNASAKSPTWTKLPDSLHSDQQSIAFVLSNPADFYFSNDGYVGLASGRGGNSAKASNRLVACQCFYVGVSQGKTLVAASSTYHTGIIRTGRTDFLDWQEIDSPEGGLIEIDPTEDATMFCSPWGQSKLHRSRDGGNSWDKLEVAIEDGTVVHIQSLAIRPNDPKRIYASGFKGRLHFSLNGGDSWSVVKNAAGVALLPNVGDGRKDGNFAFAYAPSNNAVLYLGTKAGHLWRTTTAAKNTEGWTELIPPLTIGSARISTISVAPGDPNSILVGYDTDSGRIIWRGVVGSGGNVTWTDIGGSGTSTLPVAPINGLLIDPLNSMRYFAATDVGMFNTENGGLAWRLYNEGLPRIRIIDMQLRLRSRMLYVAAYGRGIFRRRI